MGARLQRENDPGLARGFVRIPYLVGGGLHGSENRVNSLVGVGLRQTGARGDDARDMDAVVVAQGTIGPAHGQNGRGLPRRRIRGSAFARRGAFVGP